MFRKQSLEVKLSSIVCQKMFLGLRSLHSLANLSRPNHFSGSRLQNEYLDHSISFISIFFSFVTVFVSFVFVSFKEKVFSLSLGLVAGVLFLYLSSSSMRLAQASDYIQDHPSLKKFAFEEPKSPIHLGFGFSPLAVVRGTVQTSINLIEIHWIDRWLDFEVFSASYGVTISDPNNYGMHSFTFKTVPKLKIFQNVSVGPMLGLEYISFANIQTQLTRNNFFTPVDQFSSHGWVYGLAVSETFQISENYQLKANQFLYKETYSTASSVDGWRYYYPTLPALNRDASSLAPSTIFMIEFSLLY